MEHHRGSGSQNHKKMIKLFITRSYQSDLLCIIESICTKNETLYLSETAEQILTKIVRPILPCTFASCLRSAVCNDIDALDKEEPSSSVG